MFSVSRSGGRSRIPNLEPNRRRSSSLNVHSRDSYGVAVNARRASSEERKSNSAMRRFSNVRNSLSNIEPKVHKDTRPLTDKAYQKKKIFELYEFLVQNGFKAPITQSKLMQPSKKDYEMIFQFLVNFWEPTFEVKNLEEDATRVLKHLGYPFIPNKSAFMYVARTSFASLLGVLLFLMDNAKFCLNMDLSQLLLTGDSERPEEHKILMEYIFDCYPDTDDDQMVEVFEKIISARSGHNITDLERERDLKKARLAEAQKELETMEQLQKNIEDLDERIKGYEDYFLKMDKYKKKREADILNLTEEVEEKKKILRNQEEILKKKQALYDAQGFDGQKHLIYIDDLKKELNETLQQKKAHLRKVQEECWDLDIECSKILDKGDKLCKDIVHTFSQVAEASESIFNSLRNIKDPQVQNICNSYRIEFPKCPTDSTQRALMAWIDTHKELMEEIHKKIMRTSLIIKAMLSAKSEELTVVRMKKLELSTKLKCSSSAEVKKEHDLAILEKQAVEEVGALKDKCDKELANLEQLQNENSQKLDKLSKLQSDLLEVRKIKKSKSEMLLKYKEEQKKLFALMESKLETAAKEAEEYGLEIRTELGELLKRYQEERESE